jgi:ABC-type polysaccharide/polyol phosphate transport system ATPase subunit
MSSSGPKTGEALLEARGISKSYEASLKPSQLFFEEVFGLKNSRERFHALRPIDLSIERGTSLGILGRNGAGKSTLLGILAGIIEPTTGKVTRHGRIAALVGIGQSFSIEETGKENAERFCRIQGFAGDDAKDLVERIRAFAEIGGHFDRPVKTYSSGMRARLNFACATCVRADLIIVDEVLAVGDAEFRSKCYGHIEASIDAGQTYVMVSHSPAIIGNYCNRAIVIDQGLVKFDGDPLGGMQTYDALTRVATRRKRSQDELLALRKKHAGEAAAASVIELVGISLLEAETGATLDGTALTASEAPVRLMVTYTVLKDIAVPRLACGIRNGKGIMVAMHAETLQKDPWRAGETRTVVFEFIPRLSIGGYLLRLSVSDLAGGERSLVFDREGALEFQIVQGCSGGLVDVGFKIAELVRNKALADYFTSVDYRDAKAMADLTSLYEDEKVILLTGKRIEFDQEFFSRTSMPPVKGYKKFKTIKFVEGLKRGEHIYPALAEDVFGGDKGKATYFGKQLSLIVEQVKDLLVRAAPFYRIDKPALTLRCAPTFNENLHVDVYDNDILEHHLRVFVNLDSAHRIWTTSWRLSDLLARRLHELPRKQLETLSAGALVKVLNFHVFGGLDSVYEERGEPRHVAYFEPGEIWFVDSRKVSHQIFYGQRALSSESAVSNDSMADPKRHYLVQIEARRRELLGAEPARV